MGEPSGRGATGIGRWVWTGAPPVALVMLQLTVFPLPAGQWVRGLILGLLVALLATGMALVHRANRVINFAQADLGFVPTSLSVGLIVFSGLPYLFGFTVGLAAAIVLGAIVEFAFVRRFSSASRLVLTVATIGITQLLAVCALLIPRMWDRSAASQRIPPPFEWTFTIGGSTGTVLSANDLIALLVAPTAMVLVAVFLNTTRTGTAVRGSAEHSERALMLAVPVARLSTLVWSIAATLSFLALFLRAGILGVPLGAALSLQALVLALAAVVLGRLRHLPTIIGSAIALGILEYGVAWNASSPLVVTPIIGAAILIALLLQRRTSDRADRDTSTGWRLADEIRELPTSLASIPAVRVLRWGTAATIAAAVMAAPALLRTDQIIKATAVVVFAVIGMSLVVLSGWAGQISLGQMGFVAIGAAVSAKCTIAWGADITVALAAGGAAGAGAAVVVGLPALRLRGLYLAVTTLVFALAVNSWIVNRQFFGWVPTERVERLPLFGRIDLSTPGRYYLFTVVIAAVTYSGLRGVRRSGTGRAIVALRENELAAQAVSVPPVTTKLTAFAVSGAVAGVAGGLFVHLGQSFDLSSYGAGDSLTVFTAAVVGGLGSLFGGVLGAVFLRGSEWFITSAEWRLLSSATGVLLVLLVVPGGLASLVIRVRDRLVGLVVDAGRPGGHPTIVTNGEVAGPDEEPVGA